MRRYRAAILILLMVGLPVMLSAQESFEGLATVGRFGRFPSGLFGASNLVPPNTLVTVRNLETGRAARIVITDGVNEPGVFLVLSPQAAEALEIDPAVATRVRLTEVSTGGVPGRTSDAEQPLSRDPDINPLAGGDSLLDSLPPPQGDGEAAPRAEPEPEPEPESEPEPEPEPAEERPRTGIAAGIARTGTGQAQESFERPETTLPATRPEPAPVPTPAQPEEPALAPEERAAPSLETVEPRPDAEPRVTAPAPEPPPVEVAEVGEPTGAEEPAEPPAAVQGPIDEAIQSVVNRLPRKDLYPAPAGEDGDIGFRSVGRPSEPPLTAELPEVEAPAAERPSLAGLAPLRAQPQELDVELAEATPPEEEQPDVPGLVTPAAPSTEMRDAPLAEAVLREESRPEGGGLARVSPGTVDVPEGPLAEAEVAEEDQAHLADIPPVRPDSDAVIEAELAEAEPVVEEEAETAEESLEQPEEIPDDALLALEPADFRPPEAPQPDEASIISREEAEGEPEELEAELAEAVLEPAAEEAAAEAPAAAPDVAREPRPVGIPIVERLQEERYYLQIGAYSQEETVRRAVNALIPTYPMSVLPIERGGRTIYRVLVGPLERDETGTLLVWLRARGYEDTFLRSGNEL